MLAAAGVASGVSCDRASRADVAPERLVVFTAGSLARPIRAALDSFVAQAGATYELESAGSLETARKLTELGKHPDVIALADEDVFPKLLEPGQTTWHARFARNRIVLAYFERSRFAAAIRTTPWWQVLLQPGVETGRSDPDRDPAGYRALLVMQLAEQHYGVAGLANRLKAAAPERNMRAKEADLVALVQTGELDFAWQYESLARATKTPFVTLPPEIDLEKPAFADRYARATVRVLGGRAGDTITIVGAPIQYALSIPTSAPNPALAARFVRFLFSEAGTRILRREALDAYDAPTIVGTGSPLAAPPGASPDPGH